MSYHIKDYIADSNTLEKAELMIDSIDLLGSINYNSHIEVLENTFMTSDMLIPADVNSIIESVLLNSLSECCGDYGLHLSDIDSNLYRLDKVYDLSLAFFDLLFDESGEFEDNSIDESNDIDRIVELLSLSSNMDVYDISNMIDDVDMDLISIIEDNKREVIDDDLKINHMIFRRLKKSNVLNDSVIVKDIILSNELGFDFNTMFLLLKDAILNLDDLKQRIIELMSILLSSSLTNNEIKEKIDDSIDDLGNNDNEISKLRILSQRVVQEFQYE